MGRWIANTTTAVTAYVARLTRSQGCSSIRGPSTATIAIPVSARPIPMTTVPWAWIQSRPRTNRPGSGAS